MARRWHKNRQEKPKTTIKPLSHGTLRKTRKRYPDERPRSRALERLARDHWAFLRGNISGKMVIASFVVKIYHSSLKFIHSWDTPTDLTLYRCTLSCRYKTVFSGNSSVLDEYLLSLDDTAILAEIDEPKQVSLANLVANESEGQWALPIASPYHLLNFPQGISFC